MTLSRTPRGERITLAAGALDVELLPSFGGSIAKITFDGREVLRPLCAADPASASILGVACFPLLPYANRIDLNRFDFEGQEYSVAPNLEGEPYNEHGSGWTSAWRIAEVAKTSAVIELEHDTPPDPFIYAASQRFSLAAQRLRIEMSITNRGPGRMPFGLGQHPWFHRDPDATLEFNATHYWLRAPDGLPPERITVAPELAFTPSRPLPAHWRDNCYGGWDGAATLRFPSRGLVVGLRADPVFRHLMLYADPRSSTFCLEPQTNATLGLNMLLADSGVVVLAPGETLAGTIALAVEDLP